MKAVGGRQGRGQRGASLVEFSIVASLFFLLIFGLIDLSVGVFSLNSTSNAAAEAARQGSVARDVSDADQQILDTFLETNSLGIGSQVRTLTVYRSTEVSGGPSSDCVGRSQGDDCNVYSATVIEDGVVPQCGALGGGWCPEDRNAGDQLGVWFEVEFRSLTGLFPIPWRRTGFAVVQIEPDPVVFD